MCCEAICLCTSTNRASREVRTGNLRILSFDTALIISASVPALAFWFGQPVSDLNRSPIDDGAPSNEPTHKRASGLNSRLTNEPWRRL